MQETYDVTAFSLKDMAVCMRTLRNLDCQLHTMEDVAQRIADFFYEKFENAGSHARDFALVRFFKTHEYGNLPDHLRQIVDSRFAQFPMDFDSKCLTLLGTAGMERQWKSPSLSANHQVLPLPSAQVVKTMPMVSEVISALGFDLDRDLTASSAHFVAEEARSYNVFYVPDAVGAPCIPAQDDFVIPYGIQSVLAFGGMLPSRNLFIVLLFARTRIPEQTAEIFKSLAVSVKVSVVMFDQVSVFRSSELQPCEK
jgi:two-component system, NtrC family, sensor kinase